MAEKNTAALDRLGQEVNGAQRFTIALDPGQTGDRRVLHEMLDTAGHVMLCATNEMFELADCDLDATLAAKERNYDELVRLKLRRNGLVLPEDVQQARQNLLIAPRLERDLLHNLGWNRAQLRAFLGRHFAAGQGGGQPVRFAGPHESAQRPATPSPQP